LSGACVAAPAILGDITTHVLATNASADAKSPVLEKPFIMQPPLENPKVRTFNKQSTTRLK
jgi:hypothetical protein